jgi:hypothetical protein
MHSTTEELFQAVSFAVRADAILWGEASIAKYILTAVTRVGGWHETEVSLRRREPRSTVGSSYQATQRINDWEHWPVRESDLWNVVAICMLVSNKYDYQSTLNHMTILKWFLVRRLRVCECRKMKCRLTWTGIINTLEDRGYCNICFPITKLSPTITPYTEYRK